MKYTKFIDESGNFRFNLQSDKGDIILRSESYNSIHCYDFGIRSVRDNAPYDFRYEKRKVANSHYYFVLKSINDEIIGVSSIFFSLEARDKAIENIKKIAPEAPEERLIHSLI